MNYISIHAILCTIALLVVVIRFRQFKEGHNREISAMNELLYHREPINTDCGAARWEEIAHWHAKKEQDLKSDMQKTRAEYIVKERSLKQRLERGEQSEKDLEAIMFAIFTTQPSKSLEEALLWVREHQPK